MRTAKKPAVMNHRSVKNREKNSIIRVGSGSSAPSSSKSGLNCGQDVAGEHEHGAECHHHDDHRVRQGADDLRSGVELTLEVLRKALERCVELTGQFGGLQDADVVVGEHLGVTGGSHREQAAVAEIVGQVADRTPQGDVLGLVADRDERIGQRDTGLDEHRELTREVHQLLLLHLLLGELEVEHAARLFDLRREQVLFDQQRASGADGLGLGDPFDR